jgi:hypothetical protein
LPANKFNIYYLVADLTYMVLARSIFFAFLIAVAGAGAAQSAISERPVNPNLKYPTLKSYEETIKSAGLMLDSNNVRLYAPKERAEEAKIIFRYLVKAYDELYKIVGTHTEYKMIVYHFPKNHPDAQGDTSNCTIWYSYENLELEKQEEWQKYKVPHVWGYIEEMAHNFVSATHATFGWEMIGWTIGANVTKKVAGSPVLAGNISATRDGQRKTLMRYRKDGFKFPQDLPGNQCDRIHAYILYECELKYGADFWPDFFKEIYKQREALKEALKLGDGDTIRNRRYQITLDCFDRLPGIDFKERLRKLQISTDVDVESLHPTETGWDRRLMPPKDVAERPKAPAAIDPNTLPPLHLAAYGGYSAQVKELIGNGADIKSKDTNGRTALHIAAMRGHIILAEMLVKMGADTGVRDKQGYTPAELAKISGHEGTAEMLRRK